MIQHLNAMLLQFRYCFNRFAIWRNITIIVMGFILQASNSGITSIISSLMLKPSWYYSILHFFRSSGYTVTRLYKKWIEIAEREMSFVRVGGYIVMLGDHIKISKEGRHMLDIQILHQDSENSGKVAQVSAVVSSDGVSRSLPLITEKQQSPPKKKAARNRTEKH